VIFQLCNSVSQGRQKTYLFECLELDELASLIECYSPSHVTWTPTLTTNGSTARRPPWRNSQVLSPVSHRQIYQCLVCSAKQQPKKLGAQLQSIATL